MIILLLRRLRLFLKNQKPQLKIKKMKERETILEPLLYLAVAAFYAVCGIIIHFLLHDKIKERIRNSVIKQLLK